MNKKQLQKVIDELEKEQPRLDYIKGILETLVETEDLTPLPTTNPFPTYPYPTPTVPSFPSINPPYFVSNGANSTTVMDMEARAKLNGIDMSAIKTE